MLLLLHCLVLTWCVCEIKKLLDIFFHQVSACLCLILVVNSTFEMFILWIFIATVYTLWAPSRTANILYFLSFNIMHCQFPSWPPTCFHYQMVSIFCKGSLYFLIDNKNRLKVQPDIKHLHTNQQSCCKPGSTREKKDERQQDKNNGEHYPIEIPHWYPKLQHNLINIFLEERIMQLLDMYLE